MGLNQFKSNPNVALTVGALNANNSTGSTGQYLESTGTGTRWTSLSQSTTGSQGIQGIQGRQGIQGIQGTQGIQGIQGTGTTGNRGGVPYTFNSSTFDADPGNGVLRYNNGNIIFVTTIFIDNLDSLGNTQTTWYDTWDDSNNTTSRGFLYITSASSSGTTVNVFNVTGAVTVASGYYKIPVSYVSGIIPDNSTALSVHFSRTGDRGTQGIQGISGTGGSITDDTTTNATTYPSFVSTTSGTLSGVNVSSSKLQFNPSTGTLSATIFTSLSDKTQKTDIQPIENAIDVVKKLQGVKYKWIDNHNQPSIGVIAQDIEKVLPEVVMENPDGLKSVSYGNIVGLLIEAIKEQQNQIEELKLEINTLKNK